MALSSQSDKSSNLGSGLTTALRDSLLAFSLLGCGTKQDEPLPNTPTVQLSEAECDALYGNLSDEHQAAVKEWSKEMQAAKGTERADAVFEKALAIDRNFIPRFQALADRGCGEAMLQVLDLTAHISPSDRQPIEESLTLLAKIVEKHSNNYWIYNVADDDVIALFLESPARDKAIQLFERLIESTPDEEARRALLLQLGRGMIFSARDNPANSGELLAQGRKTLERLASQWPESEEAKRAETSLTFEKIFSVGKRMPEFSGRDVDGNAIALSKYQGRIVVLDFFGFWCGACVEAFPSLRDVAEKNKGSDLTILGVNAYDGASVFRSGRESHNITWPCIFDGEEGTIAKSFGVRQFPTVVVLDRAGVIRAVNPPIETLGDVIDTLLKIQ